MLFSLWILKSFLFSCLTSVVRNIGIFPFGFFVCFFVLLLNWYSFNFLMIRSSQFFYFLLEFSLVSYSFLKNILFCWVKGSGRHKLPVIQWISQRNQKYSVWKVVSGIVIALYDADGRCTHGGCVMHRILSHYVVCLKLM